MKWPPQRASLKLALIALLIGVATGYACYAYETAGDSNASSKIARP